MKISIIVPVYNVENELSRCIDSLVNQTYSDIEIILVNDGSTDNSLSICEDYSKIDSRIKLVNKENGGLSDARNVGMEHASGEYLMFVDSDDYIELDSCRRFAEAIKDSNVDVIVADAVRVEADNKTTMDHKCLQDNKMYTMKEYLMQTIKNAECQAPVCFYVFKRELFEENNLLFKKGIWHEDLEIFPRWSLCAKNIKYVKYSFYNYLYRVGSITQMSVFEKRAAYMKDIYTDWKSTYDKIEDVQLRKVMYGFLIKCYLNTFRICRCDKSYKINGIDNRFVFKYSLNFKERCKAMIYIVIPKLFIKL